MSTTIADPLFLRAEVQYRLETWGTTGHRRVPVWPDLAARLRRRTATPAARRATTRPRTGTTPVRHPRHP